jgi:hypothetical protein
MLQEVMAYSLPGLKMVRRRRSSLVNCMWGGVRGVGENVCVSFGKECSVCGGEGGRV